MAISPAIACWWRVRVLVVHNAYRQAGGEDGVVRAEIQLLRDHGHQVEQFRRHNDEIEAIGRARSALQTVWSHESAARMVGTLRTFKPDVVHVHNTFALVSPSVYWASADAGVPVVQTLHNFRLLCPQAMLLRDGQVCEDCVGRIPWRAVVRRCYRESLSETAVLSGALMLHRTIGTYRTKITRYIALNEFCRQRFIQGGLPAAKIEVKPNFIDSPKAPTTVTRRGFLFVGRLSPEKGLDCLARACGGGAFGKVRIAGSGPLEQDLRRMPNLEVLGHLNATAVRAEMASAMALVMPSIWYENFPLTLVEAFASGLPVIASRLGALSELVEHGKTGLLFTPGDPESLSAQMRWAIAHPDEMLKMGCAARLIFEQSYTAQENYQSLIAIYQRSIMDLEKR